MFVLTPLKVPEEPVDVSIHVPEITPVVGLTIPLHVDWDVVDDTTVQPSEPSGDIWPLPVPAVGPLELAPEVCFHVSDIAPVDETVADHVPLSPPPPIKVPV